MRSLRPTRSSRRTSVLTGRILPRPGRDLLRVRDDLAAVEDQNRNEGLTGQPLALLAATRYVWQRRKAVNLRHLRRMAGCGQRVMRHLARVRRRAPRTAPPRPRDGKCPPADVELQDLF